MSGTSLASIGLTGGRTGRFTYEVWSAPQAPVTALADPIGPEELFGLGEVCPPPPPPRPPPPKPPKAAPAMTILVAVSVPSAFCEPVTVTILLGVRSLSAPATVFVTTVKGDVTTVTREPCAVVRTTSAPLKLATVPARPPRRKAAPGEAAAPGCAAGEEVDVDVETFGAPEQATALRTRAMTTGARRLAGMWSSIGRPAGTGLATGRRQPVGHRA